MSAEKRSVATDALATLGMIITEGGRDAIHLAVEPVVAGEKLQPNDRIGIINGKAMYASGAIKPLGIVDPFLDNSVKAGEKFWLIVFPRQITSLRHVWSHPAFPDAEVSIVKVPDIESEVEAAQRWIGEFANKLGFTYTKLMGYADDWASEWGNGDYIYDNTETYKDYWDQFPEFWVKYEIIRGPVRSGVTKDCFFTCSC